MDKDKLNLPNLKRRDLLKMGAINTLMGATGATMANAAAGNRPSAAGGGSISSTLIRNAFLITMDDEIGDLEDADILIRNGKIVDIGHRLKASAEEVVDASGQIAIPGFIDGHRHLWQTPMRGTGTGWGFNEYIKQMLYRRAVCYEPYDMRIAALAGGLEAINAGVTSVVDHCHNIRSPAHGEAAIEGFLASGVGGIFGYCYGRTPLYGPGASTSSDQVRKMLVEAPQWRFDHAKKVKQKYFQKPDSPVSLGIATSFFETFAQARPEEAVEEMDRARTLGVDLIMQHVRARGKFRVVEFMNDKGLLGPDLMLSHADWVTEDEFQMMADNDSNIVVTPETEIKGGNSPAHGRAISAGLSVGLGMDTVIMVGGDMFGPMRWMMQFQRFERFSPTASCVKQKPADINDRDTLFAATLGGARAVGLDSTVGSLTPGKRADVVLISTDSITMQPVNDPLASVVHFACTNDIDSVWVAGKPVKRNGQLTYKDTRAVMRKLVQSRNQILERAATVQIDGSVDLYEEQKDKKGS
jgi:cytosine/adenosine deaminase-related metal-dependent hydrolase